MEFEPSSRSKSHRRHGCSSHAVGPPSSFASSSSSSSSNFSPSFLTRPTSPPRVHMRGLSSPSSSMSIRFPYDSRPTSPGRSISITNGQIRRREVRAAPPVTASGKKTCMCSPTTHPGSFRCSLHKNLSRGGGGQGQLSSSRSLNFRRSAMTNSLVRIRGVEGDLVKRALAALIRPSSHQLRRRFDFRPRPSRLSVMSCAGES